MKVFVGSKNLNKIKAVEESLEDYDFFKGCVVVGKAVSSGISEQPKTLEETILGAKNRARNVHEDNEYSFGIEGGLMKVPHTKTGFMNVCVCAIYDGALYHIGMSSAFESPKEVMDLILEEGLDMAQAYYKAGFTDNPNLGSAEGAIGLLTKGRLLRKGYSQQAIQTALIHLENFL